ncbi:hypothetical protein Tco_1079859 [Tanacetum coccineum]|uniref:Uncharacterized protein n=1 Tax=Tanacetum coccineum TaxID=301880 RepID=A0ABQ5HT92_9ASTR
MKTKSNSAISSEETPSKKPPTKAKKDVPSTKKPATKPKPTKKKAPVKVDRGKSLNILSEVSLSEAAQFKEATKRSKKDFHISQASGSGTSTKPGGPDVPKYDSESDKESWGDNGEEDDDDDNDGNDDDDSDQERTESDRDEIPNLNQFNEEHEEEEEENIDEFTHKEDHEENKEESDDGEELYKDVNVNLRKEDVEMTDADQGGADRHNKNEGPMQSSFVSSDFTEKLLNFDSVSPADNEIASLMDTTVRTEELSGQTSTLFTVPITVIPTTIPPPPHFFNPLPQQTTPTTTPTSSEVTIAFPVLPDFAFVFRFNDRVTNLERDLSEMKQVD